jgi:integrase
VAPQRINLQRITSRKGRSRPWLVRWTVDGKEYTAGFPLRAQADDYWAELRSAVKQGDRFDPDTGRPVGWSQTGTTTVAAFAASWLAGEAPTLARRSFLSIIEVYLDVLPVLVRSTAGDPPPELRDQMRSWLRDGGEAPRWLMRHSIATTEVTTERCIEVDRRMRLRLDGVAVAATTATRRVNTAHQLVSELVRSKYLEADPWPPRRKGRRRVSEQVVRRDWRTVPTHAEVQELIEASTPGYAALWGLMYYGGLRPSEATAAHIEDFTLPKKDGWGSVTVRRAVAPTASKDVPRVAGRTKTGHEREVPLPPQAVALLRPVIGSRTKGLLVSGRGGNPLAGNTVDNAFKRVRGTHSEWTPYWLRHAAATTWLAAGVSIATAARRLGHDPEVLVSTYAGSLPGDEAAANERIAAALGK